LTDLAVIRAIFKQNYAKLKKLVRLPLFALTWSAGIIAGINTLAFKLAGLMMKSQSKDTGPNAFTEGAFYTFVVMGAAGAAIQLSLLNLAMKNYNQMEVIPIY